MSNITITKLSSDRSLVVIADGKPRIGDHYKRIVNKDGSVVWQREIQVRGEYHTVTCKADCEHLERRYQIEINSSKEPFNLVGFIISYELGELGQDEIIEGFQQLINTGTIRHLQGSYQRFAQQLIANGDCTVPA